MVHNLGVANSSTSNDEVIYYVYIDFIKLPLYYYYFFFCLFDEVFNKINIKIAKINDLNNMNKMFVFIK